MPVPHRPRRLLPAALTAAFSLLLGACYGPSHPNSIFTRFTEWNRDVSFLFDILMWLGVIVFVFVEVLLIVTIWRYRQRPGRVAAAHVHGNTTLEITWTIIPTLILVFIAVPTVKTIFRTQAAAKPDALQVEVVGRQWWWEFRYPQYTTTGADGRVDTLVTANEVYLPIGRTVNFALRTNDVIHSFWISALAGKRDLISNHTNYLWFTPDSTLGAAAWNGHCAEYCGASHANMKFRTYTVTAAEFDSWVKGQQAVAAFGATPAPGQSSGPQTLGAPAAAAATQAQPAAPTSAAQGAQVAQGAPAGPNAPGAVPADSASAALAASQVATTGTAPGYTFPADKMPRHIRPSTPIPADIGRISDAVLAAGDPARGKQIYSSQSCIGCHYVNGNPASLGKIGPNLTHFGSRNTLGAGLFPNDARTLAYWIKNTRKMKPGVVMPTLGLNEYDPVTKMQVKQGGLTDQQIADIVAYLLALK